MTTHKYHNRITNRFSEQYYGNIIDKPHLVEEIVIDDQPFWYANRNNTKYLLDRSIINKLPIKITSTEEVYYSKKVYYRIKEFQTVVFKREKNHTFKELVNQFCDFEHSNPLHWTLYKIIGFSSELDRNNFRVATDAGFGKDGFWEALHILRRDVSVINPRSMPALEYRLFNKVLVLNELSNLEASQRDLVQEFLLLAGDFRTTYEKSTRASYKTKDHYNIKNLSLVCMFNEYSHYVEAHQEKKFFDNIFTKAVLDRFLPFKFKGRIDTKQFVMTEKEQVTVDANRLEYIKILRSMEYYVHNWRTHLNPWKTEFENMGLSPREQAGFHRISNFVNLYSENITEYQSLMNELMKCHLAYRKMMKKGVSSTLNDEWISEKDMKVEEISMTGEKE